MRKRILTEDDLKRKLSEFTEDTNHRTVTDAEKKTWNSKLANLVNVDSSKSKAKGNASAGKWTGVGTVRNLEDWVGDFNARSIENRDNIKANKDSIEEVRKNIRSVSAEYTYPEIIFSNTTNLGEVLNQSFNTSFYNVKSLNNITSSSSTLRELCNNEGAISLALKSDRFLNTVINSNLAMYTIANSEKAMKIAAQSRFVVRKFFSTTTAKYEIADSNTAILALLDGPYITKLDRRGYSSGSTGTRIWQGFPLASSNNRGSFYFNNNNIYQGDFTRRIYYKGTSLYVFMNDKIAEADYIDRYEPSVDQAITYVLDLDKL